MSSVPEHSSSRRADAASPGRVWMPGYGVSVDVLAYIASDAYRRDRPADTYAVLGGRSWKPVLRRDPCAYCGAAPPLPDGHTLDHIIPHASPVSRERGPSESLCSACRECNHHKGAQSLLDYLRLRSSIADAHRLIHMWSTQFGGR